MESMLTGRYSRPGSQVEKPALRSGVHCMGVRTPSRSPSQMLSPMPISSPVLYYGDEIGMGDNIWLGDRDGVRTPMQWTPDRNAGFSASDPGRMVYPPVQDAVY